MIIAVYLRDTVTGYAAMYVTDVRVDENGGGLATFPWEEGNYSCDHNRILFLTAWGERGPDGVREHGDSDDDSEFNCGSKRIVIDRIVDMAGTVLYAESQPVAGSEG